MPDPGRVSPTVPPPLPGSAGVYGFGTPTGGAGQGVAAPTGVARRRWYVASAVVVVLAVLSAAGVVGYRSGQRDEEAAPATTSSVLPPTTTTTTTADTTTTQEPTTSTTEETTTTTGPATNDPQAKVDVEVEGLESFVEKARGLEFEQPVKVKVLDDEAFEARLDEVSERDREPDEEAKANNLFHALGLIPPEVDFRDAIAKAEAGAVLGFYNPEDKELVVRGADIGPYERAVIVHELVHALDDQHFDLNRKFEGSKDESSFGFSALTEGNARHIENRYVEQLSASEKRRYTERETEFASNADLSGIPRSLLVLLVAPYEYGVELVEARLGRGGQSALDAAFTDPPTTSEQVLHPSKYLDRERSMAVPVPPADGTVIDDGVIGELGIQLMLEETVGTRQAAVAAEGWGGDWSVLYSRGSDVCVRADIVMEGPRDAQELRQALTVWADAGKRGARTVTAPEPDRVRLTSCTTK